LEGQGSCKNKKETQKGHREERQQLSMEICEGTKKNVEAGETVAAVLLLEEKKERRNQVEEH
jgi:hypothetical protein